METLRSLTPMQLRALSQELKQIVSDLYGKRLDRVVLFGSYARGDYHQESDIDFLVVLNDATVKYGSEIRYMGDRIADLSMKYDSFVSVKPVTLENYLTSDLLFYRNVRNDGKTV